MKTKTLEQVIEDRINNLAYAVRQLPDSARKRGILEYTKNLGAALKDYEKLGIAQVALEFYAKEENWLADHPNRSAVESDAGDVARDALEVLQTSSVSEKPKPNVI